MPKTVFQFLHFCVRLIFHFSTYLPRMIFGILVGHLFFAALLFFPFNASLFFHCNHSIKKINWEENLIRAEQLTSFFNPFFSLSKTLFFIFLAKTLFFILFIGKGALTSPPFPTPKQRSSHKEQVEPPINFDPCDYLSEIESFAKHFGRNIFLSF